MTTSGLGVRTVADIVQVLTRCNKAQADAAEKAICARPENVSILMQAAGIRAAGDDKHGGAVAAAIAGQGGGSLGSLMGNAGTGLGPVKAGVGAPAYGGTVMAGSILNSPYVEEARKLCKAAVNNKEGAMGFVVQHGIAQAVGISAIGQAGVSAGRR